MDSTQSDWMRFMEMTTYAASLEKQNEFLRNQVDELISRRDTLILLLTR